MLERFGFGSAVGWYSVAFRWSGENLRFFVLFTTAVDAVFGGSGS